MVTRKLKMDKYQLWFKLVEWVDIAFFLSNLSIHQLLTSSTWSPTCLSHKNNQHHLEIFLKIFTPQTTFVGACVRFRTMWLASCEFGYFPETHLKFSKYISSTFSRKKEKRKSCQGIPRCHEMLLFTPSRCWVNASFNQNVIYLKHWIFCKINKNKFIEYKNSKVTFFYCSGWT